MNDLERKLQDMFLAREGDVLVRPNAPPRVLKRTRRRQVANILVGTLTVVAVIFASVAGAQLVLGRNGDRSNVNVPGGHPDLPPTPDGFRSAALPYASIAYPDGWYLMDTSPLVEYGFEYRPYDPGSGPILELSNFDPGLLGSPVCVEDAPAPLPGDAVVLTVGLVAPGDTSIPTPEETWPVGFRNMPNLDSACEGNRERYASWLTEDGLHYEASLLVGPAASELDAEEAVTAFRSMTFPHSDQPQMSEMVAYRAQGTPRLVLDTATVGDEVITLVVYLEEYRILSVGLSTSEPNRGSAVAFRAGSDPVVSTAEPLGEVSVVFGTIRPEVARVELRNGKGDVFPATIVPLPPSLSDDRAVWGLVDGGPEGTTSVGYDANGNVLGEEPGTTHAMEIASGENPVGEPWRVTVTVEGGGLMLNFDRGPQGGGGGALVPLGADDIAGVSFASHYPEGIPRDVTGVVSGRVARVTVTLDDGTPVDAELFPLPKEFIGPAQVFIAFVPRGPVPETVTAVAYDADGNELQRSVLQPP